MKRHFLGWQTSLLSTAVTLMAQELPPEAQATEHANLNPTWDLSQWLIVTSSASSGRQFIARLAEYAERHRWMLVPPQLASPGELPEHLYTPSKLKYQPDPKQKSFKLTPSNTMSCVLKRQQFLHQLDRQTLIELELLPETHSQNTLASIDRNDEFERTLNQQIQAWLAAVSELRSHHHPIDNTLLDRLNRTFEDMPLSRRALNQWSSLITLENSYQTWLWEAALQKQSRHKNTHSPFVHTLPVDPNLCRQIALQQPASLVKEAHIILLGVLELPPLTQSLIKSCFNRSRQGSLKILIQAPPSEAHRFNELGCLEAAQWQPPSQIQSVHSSNQSKQRSEAKPVICQLDDDCIHLTATDLDMIPTAIELLNKQQQVSPVALNEIGLFTAATQQAISFKQQLREADLPARVAAGLPMSATSPFQFISSLRFLMKENSFPAMAAFVRHPFANEYLQKSFTGKSTELISLIDKYGLAFLPHDLDELKQDLNDRTQASDTDESITAHLEMALLLQTLHHWLETGLPPSHQSTIGRRRYRFTTWLSWLKYLLTCLYEPMDLTQHRGIYESLISLDEFILEFERTCQQVSDQTHVPCDAFLDFMLQELLKLNVIDHTSTEIQDDSVHIEIMGWLELYLDDRACKMILGANQNHLPGSLSKNNPATKWLTPTVRKRLGLETDQKRQARDLCILKTHAELAKASPYALMPLWILLAAKEKNGMPLAPSSLLFAEEKQLIPARLKRLCLGEPTQRHHGPTEVKSRQNVIFVPAPDKCVLEQPFPISATSLKIYLNNPYQFFLEKVLKLKSIRDGYPEMDALAFGNLAHDALNEFALGKYTNSENPDQILKVITDHVQRLARHRFGRKPNIAIQLQMDQLIYRLKPYAYWHAGQRLRGWRTHLVEKAFECHIHKHNCEFILRGRIDRIDRHDTEGYKVIDFKTSESGISPDRDHYTKKEGQRHWHNLQLPVYLKLLTANGIDLPHAPHVPHVTTGYFTLSNNPLNNNFIPMKLNREMLEEANRVLDDVLTAIASHDFSLNRDARTFYDPLRFDSFAAIQLAYTPDRTISAGHHRQISSGKETW